LTLSFLFVGLLPVWQINFAFLRTQRHLCYLLRFSFKFLFVVYGVPRVGIAIPGSRDSRIPGSRKFSNSEIPGLSRTQSLDFGINKIYVFNGLFSIF